METLKIEMKYELKPCGDRLLVRLKSAEERSAGGIYLIAKTVEQEKFATQEALVIRLGDDAYKGLGSGEKWCDVGDTVRISKYSGDDLEDIQDGYVYRVISDEDVHGVKENKKQILDISYGDRE